MNRAFRPQRLSALLLLTATLVALPARAAISPEARGVLDRYVEAMGGGAFLELRALHTRSTLSAFGLKGATESWMVRPNLHASRTEIGPLKLRDGFDGTTAWRTDPGGKILTLDGKDLERLQASAWFEAEGYLLPNQGGGSVAMTGTEKDSTGSYAVLEITPPVGKPRRCWFDAKTGLPVKQETKHDQQTIVGRTLAWRKVAGVLLPERSVTEIAGMPANTITVTLDSAWVNEEIPAALFAKPTESGGEPVRWLKTPGVAKLPFEYRSHHVWVRASVNGGPPADFIFDTGASLTVIDSAYAAKIGLETQGRQQAQGAGASGGASFAKLQSLSVAAADGDGVELSDVKVGVLSVNDVLGPFFWKDAAGVIGFDFIVRFVDEVDYDRRLLTLYDPKSFAYAGKGTPVPMTLAGHTPVVKMKLDGAIEGEFRVDVGSGSTVDLHTPFVKRHGLDARAGRSVAVTGGGFGGTFTSRITRLKKLEIGPFAWDDPVVSLSEAQSGAFTSEDYAGNIGNRLLERFTCTFDYDRRVLYLEPGKKYAEPDRFTRSGFQLARFGDTVKAMQVLAGSPAEKAGLQAGDEVTAIDGKPVGAMTPDDVWAMLDDGKAGSTHTLTVKREGKDVKLKLTLKDML